MNNHNTCSIIAALKQKKYILFCHGVNIYPTFPTKNRISLADKNTSQPVTAQQNYIFTAEDDYSNSPYCRGDSSKFDDRSTDAKCQ